MNKFNPDELVFKEVIHNSDEYLEEVKLRYEILRKPLSLQFTQEQLNEEANQFHLVTYHRETIIGTLLLKPIDKKTIHMRQVAIACEYQSKGIGKRLVIFSEAFCIDKGFEEIILHARETAVPFYLSLGYKVEGDCFTEVSLPHFKMKKFLH